MTKHKAPTQVTLAPTHEETELHRFVQRYWKLGVSAAVGVAVVIVGVQMMREQGSKAEVESWRRLGQEVGFGSANLRTPSAAVLGDLADELQDQVAGPWAKAIQVGESLRKEDYEGARKELEELEARWPHHPLVTTPLYPEDDGTRRTLRQHVEARIPALKAWEAGLPGLFANPPLPEGSPRVRLNTSQGAIVVGLYAERAPEHVENFLKLCREGFYDGTKFHRVVRGQLIQGGDPNTREGDPSTWGQGGPGYKIPAEASGLWHFPDVLAAAKQQDDTESSGSQFYITTSDVHSLDGAYTVFGVVVEGKDVVEAIGAAPVDGEKPLEPVVIESTEVL